VELQKKRFVSPTLEAVYRKKHQELAEKEQSSQVEQLTETDIRIEDNQAETRRHTPGQGGDAGAGRPSDWKAVQSAAVGG
jgi:hypothetical protein